MTQHSNEAIAKATGKTWDEWFLLLDEAGARAMPHKDIAHWLYDQKYVQDGWWCQSITVGYEQYIGRREIGQTNDGYYQTAASITLEGTMDHVLRKWLKKVESLKSFNDVPLAKEPTVHKTEKWRYWRVKLADHTRLNATIGEKGDHKSLLTISQENITDKKTAEAWKAYWKTFLHELTHNYTSTLET